MICLMVNIWPVVPRPGLKHACSSASALSTQLFVRLCSTFVNIWPGTQEQTDASVVFAVAFASLFEDWCDDCFTSIFWYFLLVVHLWNILEQFT